MTVFKLSWLNIMAVIAYSDWLKVEKWRVFLVLLKSSYRYRCIFSWNIRGPSIGEATRAARDQIKEVHPKACRLKAAVRFQECIYWSLLSRNSCVISQVFKRQPCLAGWWFQTFFIFTPIWGRFLIWLYNIFQRGWNHQLDWMLGCTSFTLITRALRKTPTGLDAWPRRSWSYG